MSFLSRRPSRSGSREGDAGRDDEYDDYDYAPDGYRGDEDENWSPGEYFSPEGIKGRWADGQRPGERPAARGRRGDPGWDDSGRGDSRRGDSGRGDSGRGGSGRGDSGRGDSGRGDPGRGDSGPGYKDRAGGADYDDDGHNGYGPGGYATDESASGAYDLPEGADEERGERGGRRRKERGERGSRLRLGRRDRGEEIWPDDGVSDEDYWASVASDRPLNGGNPALEADLPLPADSRPTGRPASRRGSEDTRAAAGPRPGADPRAAGDPRFGDERGATGRLGPPPGLAGDYQPGSGVSSSGAADWGDRTERIDRVNPGRAASGPMAGYAPSGGARPGTGPMAARPGTGPISAWSSQAGYAPSATGPRPSFQPGNGPAASRPAGGRPSDRAADWGERTERIDRVNAAGYPEPRPNGRVQAPGRSAAPAGGSTSGPFGAAAAPAAPGRGRVDNSRVDNSRVDNGRPDNGRFDGPDWRTPDRRELGRDANRESGPITGGWPRSGRGGLPGADRAGDRPGADDPLTSTAYSRASASESDGRSYRVAARRSQAQAKLTEQTQVFGAPTGYPSDQRRTGQYETGLTGEYPTRQYEAGAPAAPGGARGGQYQAGRTGDYPVGQHRTNGVSGVTGKSAADQYRTGEYQTGDYRSDDYQTGDHGQYRADGQPSDPRYPGYSGSQSGPSGQLSSSAGSGQPVQPSRRGQQGPVGPGGSIAASGPNGFGGQPVGNPGRASLPNDIGAPSGQYPAQQPRHRQPRPQSQPPQSQPPLSQAPLSQPPQSQAPLSQAPLSQAPQSQPPRQPVQPQLPATGGQGGNGQGGRSPAGSAAGRSLPASTGRNPYESAVTGSYPYPSQPYPARPEPSGNRTSGANPAVDGRDAREDRYYRSGPTQSDGYDPANDGYGAPRDRRY
jgi:hypothetical protein